MLRRSNERAIAAALIVSVLVHLAALLRLPPFTPSKYEVTQHGQVPSELSVQLAPAPPPRRPPTGRESTPAPAPSPAPRRAERPAAPPRPPVLALKRPSPGAPAAPPTAPPRTVQPPPAAADLASYVEAQRRARGESAPSETAQAAPAAESANARANRLAAANLSAGSPLTFGYDPRRSGGVFQVTRQSYDYAEFMFFGWNRDARRNTAYVVPVSRQNAPDIRIAIVRKMVSIIRDYEQGDFVWESPRLGRNVTLSARPRDTAGLEEFLLNEFFPEWRRP